MAIKYVTLQSVSTSTDEAGLTTVAAQTNEKSMFAAASDVLLTPFQINDEEGYKSNSAAAIATISWTAVGAIGMDYLHALNSGESILPFVDMLPGVSKG